ncbi:MAG: four helix bundle protein [Candidatus Pacebacteria bacterium]|nr:four helix bundle protein [Candidatus Paceibacterota bacterium]
MRTFKDLTVWQKSIELVLYIYSVTDKFPSTEVYGLTSQMRRAAVSIASNIAEGYSRNSTKEFIQFLAVALGSCSEIETQVEISKKLAYLDEESD